MLITIKTKEELLEQGSNWDEYSYTTFAGKTFKAFKITDGLFKGKYEIINDEVGIFMSNEIAKFEV